MSVHQFKFPTTVQLKSDADVPRYTVAKSGKGVFAQTYEGRPEISPRRAAEMTRSKDNGDG